ncbi:tyrosine-type recombinase/integrase [Micromonospora coxensis]|uniref:Site-specific recombinase XerD n=1 Tax=Micromonospora coxensis TaxID=356852 RepID=A0A1C5JHF7_9ACTN|nr:site-specific integrase [Micromonospora coxensis]SCG70015.1 Site-specific recombinase XerD [Micromonospora coxensis]
MDLPERPERDIAAIKLPEWGRVGPAVAPVPFTVYDDAGEPVEPIHRFLRDFVARGNRPGSVRSYAYTLLRWWRFLRAVDVPWERATSTETKDLVLWLQHTEKPVAKRRKASASTAGTVNPITRKEYQSDQYKPRTVRHSNAVLRAFYEYWIEEGQGPLRNPVPRDRRGSRPNAHHNPLEPFRPEGRLRYNPKVPKRKPRAMPDDAWLDLFKAMDSHRDRAILTLAVSTAARANELLGVRVCDVDWGDQLIRVARKGSGAEQWLPASPEAFVWLRLYLVELRRLRPEQPLWWTLRRQRVEGRLQRVPLEYDALRAVLLRANKLLGANWSMHDLRHTCALRMARDENLSLRDVQTLLGHAHLTTTQIYLEDDQDEVIKRVRQHHAEQERRAAGPPQPAIGPGYDPGDMSVLFGAGGLQ